MFQLIGKILRVAFPFITVSDVDVGVALTCYRCCGVVVKSGGLL